MSITPLTFTQYVQNWLKQWQAGTGVTANLQAGDPALAIAQADSAQAQILQFMAEAVIAFARASTSTGPDLDSWMADFGFTRLPAQFATGVATFSTPSVLAQPAYVPIGTVIQTPGAAIQYQVIADNSNPAYNSSLQSYVLAPSNLSVNVEVQSLTAGQAYNVQIGQLTQIQASLFGITAVTNSGAIQDGTNQESDAAFRARFVAYINSLSKATEVAIFEAIDSIQAGLKIALFENVLAVGNPPTSFDADYYGNIVALVDDGSGDPSMTLLTEAYNAVAATVAFGIRYQILPPAVVSPAVVMNVIINPNSTESNTTVEANVAAALLAYINALDIGATVYITKLIEIAIDADPNVIAVENASTTINSLADDYVLNAWQEILLTLEDITVGVPG